MMRNRDIPIDGEPCGVLAIPIPEQGDLRFVKLVVRFLDALGRSGADRVVWRPIGNPRSTDEAYEQMRSKEQAQADEYSAGKYDSYVVKRGSECHHQSREYNNLAVQLRISDESRPCIVFTSSPSLSRQVILHIPRSAFQNRGSENTLGSWLVENISGRIVEKFLLDGYLTVDSMARFATRIAELERELYMLQLETEAVRRMPHGAYAKLIVGGGDSYLNRDEYEDIVEVRRREYQLLVDVMDGKVYCRKGRHQRTVYLRPGAIRAFADVIAADRPVRIIATSAGSMCKNEDAAISAFTEARTAVQRSGEYSKQLFTTRLGYKRTRATYEYTPPTDFIWGVILPAD